MFLRPDPCEYVPFLIAHTRPRTNEDTCFIPRRLQAAAGAPGACEDVMPVALFVFESGSGSELSYTHHPPIEKEYTYITHTTRRLNTSNSRLLL